MTALSLGKGPAASAPPGRRFNPLRDIPALLWMLAVVGVAFAHTEIPTARWLMFHLLLLGAATHSILVWSQHFADALLHAAPTQAHLRNRNLRIGILNAGVVTVVVGVVVADWITVAVGGAAVVVAVGWHGVSLVLQLRRGLGSRFAMTVRYYICTTALLPVGVLFGVLMIRGVSPDWHARIMIAHITINVLGWIGITALGTLVTLWPTMLRTRIAEGAETMARNALGLLVGGVVLAAAGCLVDLRLLTGLGLVVYAAGVTLLARPFITALRAKPPIHFPTLSALAAMIWLAASAVILACGVALSSSWMDAHELVTRLTPALAAGFVAQILLGALSYLIPVAIGGGPAGVRAANTVLDWAAPARIVIVNTALPVALFPVGPILHSLLIGLVVAALATFIPLLFVAMRAARIARAQAPSDVPAARRTGPAPVAGERKPGERLTLAMTGFVVVLLVIAGGAIADRLTSPAGSADAGVTPTGQTTQVEVKAVDMRFTPATISVPAGNRLVITVHNADSQTHDLVLDSGARSPLLSPGQSATVDVGVVGRNIEGWCSLPGHRAMGMALHIQVTGAHHHGASPTSSADSAAAQLNFSADPPPDFVAHDPLLPPLPAATVIRRTFTVSEVVSAVAPGVTQKLWTYNGTMPGPTLHGRIGDRFEITLVNDTSMGHSIDFHAGQVAPDQPMRTLAPGASLVYTFTANHSGIWLYHCSTMPMSAHIANGMFGAVVIDPPDLTPVAQSFVLVQSELYLGPQGDIVDTDKVRNETPDAVVFNGYANQYDARPLQVRAGERIRIWVLDAGPNRPTSFHVVGGQFDTVFSEGAYLLRPDNPEHGASQALSLDPAQGGFVEMSFAEPGNYPFVSHLMIDAERGAHGIIHVQ